MSAIATPQFTVGSPPARRKKRAGEGRPTWKTIVIVTAAYLIAFVFVFPYLDMIVTALRPQSELQSTSILPHHYTFSSFHQPLEDGARAESQSHPDGGRRGDRACLVGGTSCRVLHRAAQVSRPVGILAARSGDSDVPADRHARRYLPGVLQLPSAEHRMVVDPGERWIQSGVRSLDPERLHLVDST